MPENQAGSPVNAPASTAGVTGTAAKVVYTKYDGSLHWHHDGWLLGEDEHGAWLGCPPRTRAARGAEPPVVWEEAFVMLFPRDAWWTATFNDRPARCAIYCDITTVPRWLDGQVTMVDLDLDVLLMRDGRLFVDDEDEFAEHLVRYGYPSEVIGRAESSAAWLMAAIAAGTPPFDGTHERWLSGVR
ncbi:DUF402 domain-containing protein [Sphaerisporangium album]|uniref:DUF402 domain-containing protein n=1 Tax=Sphaerisporangium album TaxID=509200 RepID=A0A367FQ42_9ACTN|nr:DUF402 domain-containing protein [Sphaerisporangium album]RCG32526.1 DUF402 domain-containing protein [Sphaerisporangium album]